MSCLGSQDISTQADLVSIMTDVTCVGSLSISGSGISDLSPLNSLVNIQGYLSIDNTGLSGNIVDAFPSLNTVDWNIWFVRNHGMTAFNGFRNLQSTGDNLDIWWHDSLTSLTGFDSLHTIGWTLEIGDAPILTELPAFTSLTTIPSSIFLLDLPNIEQINGFQSLQHTPGSWSFQVVDTGSIYPPIDMCGFQNYFDLLPTPWYTNVDDGPGGHFQVSRNGVARTLAEVMSDPPCPPEIAPEVLIVNLQDQVINEVLNSGLRNQLDGELGDAFNAVVAGNTATAEAHMIAAQDRIHKNAGNKLTTDQAADYTAQADAVIIALYA